MLMCRCFNAFPPFLFQANHHFVPRLSRQRNLPRVLEYVANQKEHHAQSKVVDRLERADVDE
jgi:hypothetical protein